MNSLRKIRESVITALFVTMMFVVFIAAIKVFTDAMWPVTTLLFASVGTCYSCKRWTTGAFAIIGIGLYVMAWVFMPEMSTFSCSALASAGVIMWFTALCWPTLSRRSVTTPRPS